jgi:putative salt-induced outer membrane protein
MPGSFTRLLFATSALVAAPAFAQELPAPEPAPPLILLDPPPPLSADVRLMIETAIADGDETAAKQVIAVARKISPRGDAEIDAIEKAWKAQLAAKAAEAEEKRLARLRNAGPFDVWSGNVEVGGARATGTSDSLGAFASVSLERATIDWTHKLVGSVDLQRTNGQTSAERLLGSWQPSYRFSPQTYAFGLAQYEHDPFAGYDTRATLGTGLGYRPLHTPNLTLELEGGPALRYTAPIDGMDRTHFVGRGSLNLQWQVSPTLKLSQQTAIFLERKASNAVATTALDTKLIGNLKARLSYNIQYEGNSPLGTDALNTQSRVTFLYGF